MFRSMVARVAFSVFLLTPYSAVSATEPGTASNTLPDGPAIADIIRINGTRGPDFPPGTKADYSNYGFILLGAVIEEVTGGSYYDYVAKHVFKPAEMTKTGFPDRDHLQDVAVG